jgi:hypothetical protein
LVNKENTQTLDSGKVLNLNKSGNNLHLGIEKGIFSLSINNKKLWDGQLVNKPGVFGIMLDPHSYLFTNRFEVKGKQIQGNLVLGYYEALLNSGNQDSEWEFKKDSLFKYGKRAISKQDNAFAKWNFEGTGFEIFLPKGPLFGSVAIYIDGQPAGIVNLKNDKFLKSGMVFKSKSLKKGSHAVYIETTDGRLPLDCIKVYF